MKSQAIVIGIVGLMALAAFAGLVNAGSVVDSPKADDRYAMIFTSSVSGVQICDMNDPGMPYGNVTFYNVRTDVARCPEEYAGYVVDAGNGHGYNAGFYYVSANFGAGLTAPWNPASNYIAVVDIMPTAYGGHHPTALVNYTTGTQAVWANDFEMYPDAPIQAIPTPTAANVGGAAQLTWTDLSDPNGVIVGYPVYKSVGGGAWTYVTTIAQGVQTFTDGPGTFLAANRYVLGTEFSGGYRVKGRSPIAHCGVVVDNPPVANAGPDQIVNEDTLVTFTGAASTDDNGISSYSWTFTDGVLRTLTGVGPTWTFANPGAYTVTLTVTDTIGQTDTDTVLITVNDNSPIVVTDNTPGTVEPGAAFDITCVGTDYQTLVSGSIVLYWEDVDGVQAGPVAASTFVSVGDNQITKADDGNTVKDTHTWTWNIPAQANPGEVHYWFATDDGAGHTATAPVGATFLANYAVVLVQIAGNQNQPHPLVGRIYDNATGAPLDGAIVTATWWDSSDLAYFTNWTVSAPDGLGVSGWYQIDIFHNNWTAGDLLWVNATFYVAGVPYYGYNTTLFQSGDDFLPDDDKEYINVYIDIIEFFELKWTMGWNIWSHPMIRSENATLGLTDLPFSWFANEHWLDTSQVGVGDEATLVAWNGAAYITYVYPLDNGTGNDITVTPDNGYWAYVAESWFTDEATLAIPELGVLVPGQYIWRSMPVRTVAVVAGWNLLGWTSFNTTFVATDVIWTLNTCPVGGMGIAQPEIIANWTSDDWEYGNTADMQHWEGAKGYTTFVSLGAYGQSTAAHDFPVGPGYGFWIYTETAGNVVYVTI